MNGIKVLLFFMFIIWVLHISYQMDTECNEKGGVLVRGAIKWECVKGFEKVE